MSDEGGGASHTTDPASGTSAATDVSLREYSSRDLWWLDRHLTAKIDALARATSAANENAETAIEVARIESKERLDQHNGLIAKMEKQAATFPTREVVDALMQGFDLRVSRMERLIFMAMGGLMLVGLVGVANLVKIWTG